jgi:hypothetical protein
VSCACKIGGGLDGVCFECKSRAAFHKRLTKLEASRDVEYDRGIAEGRRLERAAIVADLRAMAPTFRGATLAYRDALEWTADRIERGEHEEAT